MKYLKALVTISIIILALKGNAGAGGPFGAPQPIASKDGGFHTGIGYWQQENKYQNNAEHAVRQNQVYSEIGYGVQNRWEFYARIGIEDFRVLDAFISTIPATTTSKMDFEENLNFFSTLGAKIFFPFHRTFGMGAFLQGTYNFRDFTDRLQGTSSAGPFDIELRIKDLWDVQLGLGLQTTIRSTVRLYLGPAVAYSEAKLSSSATIPGLKFAVSQGRIEKSTNLGAYFGFEAPLGKGFSLTAEVQYSDRVSAGTAVTLSY